MLTDNPVVKALKPAKRASLTLTNDEAEEYRDTLAAALESDFDALDKYLWSRQRLYTPDDANDEPIWSNMTEKEITTLTRVMIKGGQHSPAMATVVRGVIDSNEYIAVATILVPRLKTSGRVMRETHRPSRGRVQR